MSKEIIYGKHQTSHSVKGTRTKVKNDTDGGITLLFDGHTKDIPLDKGDDVECSSSIKGIKYKATIYYSMLGNDYVIPARNQASIKNARANDLKMDITSI